MKEIPPQNVFNQLRGIAAKLPPFYMIDDWDKPIEGAQVDHYTVMKRIFYKQGQKAVRQYITDVMQIAQEMKEAHTQVLNKLHMRTRGYI